MDVNLVDCIGEPRYFIAHPPGRQLNSALPTARQHYLTSLSEFAIQHKLPQKLEFLFQSATDPNTLKESLQQALELFDCVKME